jgi:hypothetical protein
MAEQLIFIGTYTIKEGKLEDFKQYSEELCKFVEANEPRLIHFALYINEDGTEVSVVQVHPDEASMTSHMQVVSEHLVHACEFLDTTKSVQVYGTPSDSLVEQLKQASEPGTPLVVKSELAGFFRLSATVA